MLGILTVSFAVEEYVPPVQEQQAVAANTQATGQPIISGTVQVGETLTADVTGIADEDGLTNVVFSYQWMADDTNIQGATGSSYTLTEDDKGKAITVRVSFTDDANNEESLTSEPTGPVVPDPGPLTVFTVVDTSSDTDTVLGTLEDGGALPLANPASGSYGIRVDTDSGHDDHDDIHKVELALSGAKTEGKEEWVPPYSLYGDEGEGNLTGENLPAGAYELKATAYDDDGDVLGTLKVSFTVTAGQPAQQPTVVPNTSATGVPTISGTLRVGETLTADVTGIADVDGLSGVTFSYQWVSNDGTADRDIAGATDSTYTLVAYDEGKTIRVRVSFTDDGGNEETLTSAATAAVAADPRATPPTISSIAITSDTGDDDSYYDDDGVYGIGDSIEVTVTFSENVSVTGTPRLELDIGGASNSAEYERAQGSAVMFSYTVAEGDADSDGIAIEADNLTLHGGSIKDSANNVADLSHNALPAQEDHRVDGIRPTIWRVYLSGGFGKPYTVGTEIRVRVEFTESARISGRPQLALDFDGTPKTSEWAGGWRGSFSYAIQEGDRDSDGVAIGANAISLNGGTVRDGAGNDAVLTHGAVAAVSHIKVDAVVPTVSSIAITSDPGDDDTYGAGDRIEVTVIFSEVVEVWNVTRSDMPGDRWPQLELDIGGEARTAEYQSFTGAEVVFEYTVQDGDTDENGIALGANKLALNGGAIFDYAENHPIGAGIDFWDVPLDAVVSHDAVSDDAGHKVDVPPSPLTLSGDTTLRILENNSRYVAGYRVSGTDGPLTWSLSGDDSDDFKISSGGTVNWVSSPNYEDPADADKDNRYRMTIQASDGTNEAKLQVTVVVTNMPLDADEVPTVTGTAQVGETLTADTSLISFYPHGLGPWYFWLRSDGTTGHGN